MALTLLLISLLAFALGPVLYALADRAKSSLAALDGFVMIAVAGLAMVHIIPHAVANRKQETRKSPDASSASPSSVRTLDFA